VMCKSFCLALFLAVIYISLVSVSSGASADRKDTKPYGELGGDREYIYEQFAEMNATMLICMRNVIAKNQELINRDPETGNYYFKGFCCRCSGKTNRHR